MAGKESLHNCSALQSVSTSLKKLTKMFLNGIDGASIVPLPFSSLSHVGTVTGNTINISISCENDKPSLI